MTRATGIWLALAAAAAASAAGTALAQVSEQRARTQPPAPGAANTTAPARNARPAPTAPPTARVGAPVDLTGYWVTVVSEDWAWRMRTPPKGDYASVPLNAEGTRVANTWTEAQTGSCLAFGAAALMRTPTRVHVSWADDQTLKLETDNGVQTRMLRFEPPGGAAARAATAAAAGAALAAAAAGANQPAAGASSAAAGAAQPAPRASGWMAAASSPDAAHSLQGESHAAWEIAQLVRGSGADGGVVDTRLDEARWASLKVVTTSLSAGWLRSNGVPYSADAVVTEYYDIFAEGDDLWFTVTTSVDDPVYLNEPFVTSSNFKREPNGSKWKPAPCKS
jgi:hypothetical protein